MPVVGYTVREIQDVLGLSSVPAVRNRIEILRPVLEKQGHIKRGSNNEILITPEGVQLLQRLEEKHKSGTPLKRAAQMILEEIGISERPRLEKELSSLAVRLTALEKQVAKLGTEIATLKEKVERHKAWFTPIVNMFARLRLPPKTGSGKGSEPGGDT